MKYNMKHKFCALERPGKKATHYFAPEQFKRKPHSTPHSGRVESIAILTMVYYYCWSSGLLVMNMKGINLLTEQCNTSWVWWFYSVEISVMWRVLAGWGLKRDLYTMKVQQCLSPFWPHLKI